MLFEFVAFISLYIIHCNSPTLAGKGSTHIHSKVRCIQTLGGKLLILSLQIIASTQLGSSAQRRTSPNPSHNNCIIQLCQNTYIVIRRHTTGTAKVTQPASFSTENCPGEGSGSMDVNPGVDERFTKWVIYTYTYRCFFGKGLFRALVAADPQLLVYVAWSPLIYVNFARVQ